MVLLLFLGAVPAADTWSVVAVVPATGEISGVGPTCTLWASAIFGLILGKGIIVSQAASNRQARRRGDELQKQGASPAEIIAAIADPGLGSSHAQQQHGIAAPYP